MTEGNDSALLEKQRLAFEITRQRRKRNFVLTGGVLGWGLPVFILTSCINIFVFHYRLNWFLVISALMWGAAGYGWGLLMWHWLERRNKV